MLRTKEDCRRPVERLARRAGYEIHEAPHCREGHWYQVGGRVLILAPTWIAGRAYREASISRQLALHRLAVDGETACVAELVARAARYAGRHTGPVAAPLADGEAAG
jgi:hypothetical protein